MSASPEPESPVAVYLIQYFVRETVDKIINRFELYNVSDLCNITDAQIDAFQRSGALSWGEERMLKHIVNFHKTSSEHVGPQRTQMRQMKHLLHQLTCMS